jgi:hypothetical protein
MSCFSDDVRKLFKDWKQEKLCEELENFHKQLLERRVDAVEYSDPEKLSAKLRTRLNCQVLRQALLHRAERLIVSSGTMFLDKNIYGLALIVRGHVEGTAVLGYFCNRVQSFAAGNIPFEKFDEEAADTIMGAKHDLFSKAKAPKNILTMIEKDDRFLDGEIFKSKKEMLKDIYGWLSEFAHPNFLSNSSAFKLDKPSGRMVFRHDNDLQESDFQQAGYLSISAKLFIAMYDIFDRQAGAALVE